MSRRRVFRVATVSARVLAGGAAAVGVVAAVIAGVAAPWPVLSTEPVRVEAAPAATDTALACTGPLLALGRVLDQAGALTLAAEQAVEAGPASADAVAGALTAPGGSVSAFVVPPDGSAPGRFGAAGASTVESADLRGFAASACRPALTDSWIVGGSTTLGSGDLLLLANPGQVAATVQITVFGAAGAVDAPGGVDQVVPAGAQVVVPLAGLAPGEASPAVRVSAGGAPVVASLQSSLVRTLVPGGVDQLGAAATAEPSVVVTGVAVTQPPADAEAASTLVRVLAPSADTQASVSVVDAEGRAVGDPQTVPLVAGVPSELELSGLGVGRYTVQVDAAEPIVAGAWSTTGFGDGADFAWYAAAPLIERPSVVAVAAGPAPALTIVAGADDAVVTLTAPDGTETELEIPAAEVVEVPLSTGSYLLDPSAPVRAAVSYAGAGALAGYPVWSADAGAAPVTVYP